MMEKINLIIESFDSTRYQCQVTPSETIGHIVGELMQELSVETDGEVPSDIQSVQHKSERPEIQVYLTEEDGSKIRLAPLDLNATFFQEKIADGSILKLTRSVFRDFLTDSGLAKFGQAISNITHRKSQATAIRMDNWLNLSLTLVYIPEEGRCNEFSFSADPGMKVEQLVMDFLYEFTDKGKKGSSQGSAEFDLLSKDIPQLLSKDKTLWELKISNGDTLILSTSSIIKSLLPFIQFLPKLPKEVLLRGRINLHKYFLKITSSPTERLNESKLMILGDQSSGKTSMVNRLIDDSFNDNEPMTKGVEIKPWYLTIEERDIRLNVWDFGGHEAMHPIYQFFLTKNAVYLIAVKSEMDASAMENSLVYWLELIKHHAPLSPVIIVVNKMSESSESLYLEELENGYPNIVTLVEVSCYDNTGIPGLRKAITDSVTELLVKKAEVQVPVSYLKVKKALENDDRGFLTYYDYRRTCENVSPELKEDDIANMTGFFHDTGILFNLSNNRLLRDSFVLKTSWIAKGLFNLMSAELLQEQGGIVSEKKVEEILRNSAYSTEKARNFILDILSHFELCVRARKKGDTFLYFPEAFPEAMPQGWQPGNFDYSAGFQYHCSRLPRSIMASLIVTYHSYMRTNSYWRNGCIVEDGKQSAIVVADYDENRIKIKIAGQSKKPFLLKIIREDFERIRQKYSGLKVRKMIPIDKQEKHFISYEDLKACYEANVKRHFHPESGQHIDVEALYEHIDGGIEQKDRIAEQIKYIRELIEAGKLSRALKKVSELSLVDETKNEVLNYISQLKGVDQDRRLGLATDKDIAIVTNRIRNSFIELLGEIEEDPWLHLE